MNKIEYPLVTFLTGAAVLIIEILATRLVSPFFGNTIYTVSSILSVVLFALAIGYYLGGLLADRYPSAKLFYSIILFAALTVAIIPVLNSHVLPNLVDLLSLRTGPLVSSLIFLFLPSFLLGIISPFAIKLSFKDQNKIASASGLIFFWSTTGSIIGSLATGFYLIPNFELTDVIFAVAIILAFISLLGIYFHSRSPKTAISCLLLSAALLFCISLISNSSQGSALKVLHQSNGIYERIRVYDGIAYEKPARFIEQDHTPSGAIFLSNNASAYEYADYVKLSNIIPDLRNVLILGGGAYIIPNNLLPQISSNGQIDVVEIEPILHSLAKKYFGLSDDQRIKNHIADGRQFLKQSKLSYDLIFNDVYRSLYSMPAHFTTKEFFEEVKNKLKPDGLFISNIIGNLKESPHSFVYAEIKTIKEVFPNTIVFKVDDVTPESPQNLVSLSAASGTREELIAKVQKLKMFSREGDHLSERILKIEDKDRSYLPVFTDNYAPVDYFVAMNL